MQSNHPPGRGVGDLRNPKRSRLPLRIAIKSSSQPLSRHFSALFTISVLLQSTRHSDGINITKSNINMQRTAPMISQRSSFFLPIYKLRGVLDRPFGLDIMNIV
jgi:hypothetical protein